MKTNLLRQKDSPFQDGHGDKHRLHLRSESFLRTEFPNVRKSRDSLTREAGHREGREGGFPPGQWLQGTLPRLTRRRGNTVPGWRRGHSQEEKNKYLCIPANQPCDVLMAPLLISTSSTLLLLYDVEILVTRTKDGPLRLGLQVQTQPLGYGTDGCPGGSPSPSACGRPERRAQKPRDPRFV